MSNIPKARALLLEALALLDRKKPTFRVAAKYPNLTLEQRFQARDLRFNNKLGINEIARRLNTNSGRVSEAINV